MVELQNQGFDVVIVDNLCNSSEDVLEGIQKITGKEVNFEKLDLRDKSQVAGFFQKYNDIQGVIHFAACKAVGESVANPLTYYENNVSSLVYLLQELTDRGKSNFIFSSSCTVYGQADIVPITEGFPSKTCGVAVWKYKTNRRGNFTGCM